MYCAAYTQQCLFGMPALLRSARCRRLKHLQQWGFELRTEGKAGSVGYCHNKDGPQIAGGCRCAALSCSMTWQLSWRSSGEKHEPAESRVGPSCAATVWNGALVGWMNGFVFGAVYGAVPFYQLLSKTRRQH